MLGLLGTKMLERESNKEKNLEKALREAKIKARKEAAAKEAAEKEKVEDAEDLQQVCNEGQLPLRRTATVMVMYD